MMSMDKSFIINVLTINIMTINNDKEIIFSLRTTVYMVTIIQMIK